MTSLIAIFAWLLSLTMSVDPGLVSPLTAIAIYESYGNPNAVGQQGEIGLLQHHLYINGYIDYTWEDRLYDPVQNIMLGSHVIHDRLNKGWSMQTALSYWSVANRDLPYGDRVYNLWWCVGGENYNPEDWARCYQELR